MLWGKRGWESELTLLIGSWWDEKENTLILRGPGRNNRELLWEHEKQFLRNLVFYWSWRSSISSQQRPKFLELRFISHWSLKSHVPWTTRRIRILWRGGGGQWSDCTWKFGGIYVGDILTQSLEPVVGNTSTLRVCLHQWNQTIDNVQLCEQLGMHFQHIGNTVTLAAGRVSYTRCLSIC